MTKIKTIWQERPIDAFFLVCLLYFIFGWLSNDLPHLLGIETDTMTYYMTTIDPLQKNPPKYFVFIFGLAAFVYGPSYLIMFYGIWHNKRWTPKIVLPISGMIIGTTLTHMYGDMTSSTPPLNIPAFLVLNGLFVILPLLMIFKFA